MGSPDHPHCFRMVPVYPMWDPVVICTVAPIGDPCGPCGSSGLLVYGTHLGSPRFIPCGLLVYGTHVGSPRFTPCGILVYGTHVGSPRFIPCGLLVYGTHVGSPRFTPCGLLAYGSMLEASDLSHVGFWYMGRMWAAQIAPIVHVWCPFSPSGTQSSFAPWHPSGAHVGNSCIIP